MSPIGPLTDKKVSKIVAQAIDADLRMKAVVRVMKKYGLVNEDEIKSSYRLMPLGNTRDAKILKQMRLFRSHDGLIDRHSVETQIKIINAQICSLVALLEINGLFEKPKNFKDNVTQSAVQRFHEGKGLKNETQIS